MKPHRPTPHLHPVSRAEIKEDIVVRTGRIEEHHESVIDLIGDPDTVMHVVELVAEVFSHGLF